MQRDEIKNKSYKCLIKNRESRKTMRVDKTKIQQIENSYKYGRY